jgi:hypothetical protein
MQKNRSKTIDIDTERIYSNNTGLGGPRREA